MNMNNITMTQAELNSAVQIAVQSALLDLKRPQLKGDTITLTEYAVTWFESKKYEIQQTTFSKYWILYRKHIKPALGSMVLSSIKREQVQSFINTLAERQYKQATIKEIKNLLYAMLKLAVADDYIYKNPCDVVKLPKLVRKKKRPATLSEYLKLLEVSKGHRLWIAIPLLFLTGCRRGELLALTWKDIDFQAQTIHVNKEYIVETSNGKAFLRDTTKTPAGVRCIGIRSDLCSALEHYRDNEGKGRKYVLSQARADKMVHPSTFYRLFKNWLYAADLPADVSPHSARHFYASTLIKAGVSLEIIRGALGHSDLSTTLDTYCQGNEADTKDIIKAQEATIPALSPIC